MRPLFIFLLVTICISYNNPIQIINEEEADNGTISSGIPITD